MFGSIVDLLEFRADQTPDRPAYTFLPDADEPVTVSYAELHRRAAVLAAILSDEGDRGDRVLVLLPPGIDYIVTVFACLYAGRIAVPAYPPHPARLARTLTRMEVIARDADASVAVTSAEILLSIPGYREQAPKLASLRWLAPDMASAVLARSPTPFEVAILQYTSGSTADPRGVVLAHANLLSNLEMIRREFGQSSETRGVFWLPPYHDMGLIGGIMQPLYAGYPAVLMSPASFSARPLRWLEAISQYRGSTSGGPNFAYDLCIEKTLPEERAQLDLRSWTVAFNGAEPIRADTLDRFAAAFAVAGFRKEAFLACYGLAEATLLVSCGRLDRPPSLCGVDRGALGKGAIEPGTDPLVSCGHAAAGLVVRIVDPERGMRLPDGAIGEIWVSGASVASGYWGQPQAACYGATLAEEPGCKFLRTGDLGAIVNGELIITGREKDLILVRGQNIYPQDIELAAQTAHPAIQLGGVAAFSDGEPTTEERGVIIVCEVKRGDFAVSAEIVARAVRRAVAERCGVALASVVLVRAGMLPKTTSGKIRRRACRAELAAGRLVPIAVSLASVQLLEEPDRAEILAADGPARVALITRLIRAVAARHGAARAEDAVSLLDIVPDSIGAVELAADLNAALGVEIGLADVIGDMQISDLAARLAAAVQPVAPSLPPGDPSVLSPAQKALWLTQRLRPDSAAYNVTAALRLHGQVDVARVEAAIDIVARRHQQLRISITSRDGQPRAIPKLPPRLTPLALEDEADPADQIARIADEPFDLEAGPLWRAVWLDGRQPILLLCAHHVIADYASLHVLLREVGDAIRGRDLPAITHDYPAFVASEAVVADSQRRDAARIFWARELADLPMLDLAATRPRPSRTRRLGAQHEMRFSEATLKALRALARAERTTLHTVLLAGLCALLQRWTGQDDIVIGTPVTGRRLHWMQDLIGYCVNPLPIRGRPRVNQPFVELVHEVRDRVIDGISHALPFAEIVEAAGVARDASRTPVFQALFALERAPDGQCGLIVPLPGTRLRFADVDAEPLLVRARDAAFDLVVLAEESQRGLAATVRLGDGVLDATGASRLADQWVRLLAAAAAAPDVAIGCLPLLGTEERAFVLTEVNRTAAPLPDRCLHQLVADQAARTPDAPALIVGTTTLSYRELVGRAAVLAAALRQRGVGPEVRVGLYVGRDTRMVVAVLGILGAGGAYVYLDPHYPRDRVAFTARDAGISLLVTTEALRPNAPPCDAPVVTLETICEGPGATAFADTGVRPENLAYVIYTSGSTGRPKGVAIEHRNAIALIAWAHSEYEPSVMRGVLAATSLGFDLSVFELFAPLTCGGTVILADTALDLPHLPARDRVTLINTVPSAMNELIAAQGVPANVRVVNLAGEPLSAPLAASVYGLGHVERLYNLYGPTEDTTYSTFEFVERGETPTLGRSLANRTAYVLNELGEPAPLGVVGEIFLGGAGVTRGYLGRPDLTAERYVESTIPEAPGRLYRTGDLGRRLADGRIEYLGRRDRQVKVRGFRIELGEIVANLLEHPAVADAVVLTDGEQRLLAYVGAPGGADATILRTYLETRLPPYMVPNRIDVLAALPETPNGKIDHDALRARPPEPVDPPSAAVAGATEIGVGEIWRDVLGVEAGPSDDFFAVGGHSLLAARVQARIRSRFGVDLPLTVMFERSTIEGLSRVIESEAATTAFPPIRAVPRGQHMLGELDLVGDGE